MFTAKIHLNIIKIAAILGALAVVLGAIAAHALEKVLETQLVESFKTGVYYQMIHVFFLLIIAILGQLHLLTHKQLKRIFILAIVGILFFSGSIYGLTLCNIYEYTAAKKVLGPITPIGGLLLILAWLFLFFSLSKQNSKAVK